jgi:hypothetical protein
MEERLCCVPGLFHAWAEHFMHVDKILAQSDSWLAHSSDVMAVFRLLILVCLEIFSSAEGREVVALTWPTRYAAPPPALPKATAELLPGFRVALTNLPESATISLALSQPTLLGMSPDAAARLQPLVAKRYELIGTNHPRWLSAARYHFSVPTWGEHSISRQTEGRLRGRWFMGSSQEAARGARRDGPIHDNSKRRPFLPTDRSGRKRRLAAGVTGLNCIFGKAKARRAAARRAW